MNILNEIMLYLEDIKNYVSSYTYYLSNLNENLDKNEIDMYISSIPEIVDKLKEIIVTLYEEDK